VDWERIALMGHSRGGEAVGHAAAFNRLAHYPDDASFTFDFGFNIRSLVAIAPVDGQYEPANRPVPLEDVNYLVFHGSHDGDVTSFAGLRQYSRVHFTGQVPAFKSAVYVYRANHGQWNEGWGAFDNGPRSRRILRLDGLLPEEDQLEFGRIYITAFLEATLKGEERWLPLFRDHRTAGGWLPPTMYQTRFQHASFRPLADYSEDIDLTTGTEPGVTLRGEGLSTWREGELVLRSRLTPQRQVSQQRYGAWLGWHRTDEDDPPHYAITLPAALPQRWNVGEDTTLDLLLAPTGGRPAPPASPGSSERGSGDDAEAEAEGDVAGGSGDASPETGEAVEGQGGADEDGDPPLELTLQILDAGGESATLPLSRFGPIRRPLEIRILRRRDLERNRFPTPHELVGHGFSIPLDEFTRMNPSLELGALREIRLVFDGSPVGEVVLSEVGLSRPGAAFLEPRVRPREGGP
jgi:hypothetical protein